MKKTLARLLVTTALLGTIGCDPNQIVNDFFAKQGLNRLAVLRDDIQPGGLILVGKQGALYADNMLDYVNSSDEVYIPISVRNGTSEFDAVIRSYQGDRNVKPAATLDFLKQVLPLSLSGSLKLSANVKLDQIEARVKRMKIPDIRKFLVSEAANGFKSELDTDLNQKQDPYLIYETWSTNKIKLVADGGNDISSSIKVGEVGKLISGASGEFTYTKIDKSTLEINGSKYYVFAVRTGKLQKNGNGFDFFQAQFVPPSGFGVKAAGTDIQYSAPVRDEGVVLLKPRVH